MTDQIADLLSRIRNSGAVQKYEVIMPFSKMKEAILRILEKEGFVHNVEIIEEDNKKTIKLRISERNMPTHLKQISKPGQRIYVKHSKIPKPLRGFGLVVISTPKGVISGREAAKAGLGGELICEVW